MRTTERIGDKVGPKWLIASMAIASAYGVILFWASLKAEFFDGYFANGAFQLFDPLRRISAGQMPGRDFYLFHGIGTTLLHYPVFALFGKNLYASEVAHLATSPTLFLLVIIYATWLISRSLAVSCSIATIALLASPYLFFHLLDPANTALGVRSAFGVAACAALLVENPWRRDIVLVLSIAAAIVGSTEQGIAVVLASGLIGVLHLLIRRSAGHLVVTLAAVAVGFAILGLLCGSNFPSALKYYYRDIIGDQAWYFGAPPNPFGSDGFRNMIRGRDFWIGTITAVACICIVALQTIRFGWTRRNSTAVFFIVYGCVTLGAMTGYVLYTNMEPFVRACVIAALVVLLPKQKTTGWQDLICGVMFLATVISFFPFKRYQSSHGIQVLGVTLSDRWSKHLEGVNRFVPPNEPIWSDYFGMVEATHGGFQPSSDYIIHVLGPENRDVYTKSFSSVAPKWVRTDNICAWDYGIWLLNENWPFFSQLFTRYTPVFSDSMGALFERSNTEVNVGAPERLALDENGCATVKANKDGLWEINEQSEMTSASPIAFLNRLPRYLITQSHILGESIVPDTAVSLPLIGYQHSWSFPLRMRKGDAVKLCPVVTPKIGHAALRFTSVEARAISVPKSTLDYMDCRGKDRAYYSRE